MRTIDISEAQARLARLVDKATRGESFMIAKAGIPLVKVTAAQTVTACRRLGFMAGEFNVPDDFDRMGGSEIELA